jgi:hypothetical protein
MKTFRDVSTRIVLTLILFSMVNCASTRLPQTFPETLDKGCVAYESTRDAVVFIREQIKVYWMFFPERMKSALLVLDEYLPAADETGKLICVARDILKKK